MPGPLTVRAAPTLISFARAAALHRLAPHDLKQPPAGRHCQGSGDPGSDRGTCRIPFPSACMTKAQKNTDVSGTRPEEAASPAAPAAEKRRPLTTLRQGDVSASVWSRDYQVRGATT